MVSSLKFSKRKCFPGRETLVEVMAAARVDLATYRDILEISGRIKKPEVKNDFKERPHYVASAINKNFSPKTFISSSPVSSSYSNKSGYLEI